MRLDVTLKTGRYLAEFDSSAGGVCYRLYDKGSGCELLRTPDSEEALEKNPFLFGNPILFPPNRIRGGEFTFEGRQYRFPINEPDTGCHLHGALYRTPFAVERVSEEEVVFAYRAGEGEYPGFPHAFRVERHYTLSDDAGLKEVTRIFNDSDQVMPVMLAYHTTFRIPFAVGGRAEDHRLILPVERLHKRDAHYLPTCEYETGGDCEDLRKGQFVPCEHVTSAFFKANGSVMRLTDLKKNLTLEYRTEGFGYWMLYNGGSRDFLTVEPQTCAIDAFHIDQSSEQAGVISLLPGKSVAFMTELAIVNE